jgi:hypothetical protein
MDTWILEKTDNASGFSILTLNETLRKRKLPQHQCVKGVFSSGGRTIQKV